MGWVQLESVERMTELLQAKIEEKDAECDKAKRQLAVLEIEHKKVRQPEAGLAGGAPNV